MVRWGFVLVLVLPALGADYPKHWWKEVPKDKLKSWEISPHKAGPGEVILSKRNELGILSNFAATPIRFRKRRYPSLEGFWQMMKFPEGPKDPRAEFPGLDWTYTRSEVSQLIGHKAKKAGSEGSKHMKAMGINWVTFEGKRLPYRVQKKGEHYRLIRAAMWAKVQQNEDVKSILLRTGHLKLRPDHHQKPDAPPAWKYFQIWMEIRSRLQLSMASR